MPKFNGQNKKRNNPRYFLNETTDKNQNLEEISSYVDGQRDAVMGRKPSAQMMEDPEYARGYNSQKKIKEGEKQRTWDDAYAMGLPEPEFRAPWNSTKDMIDKLGEQAREASKAIYGYKVDVGNMTLDQIQDLLYDMSNSDVQRAMDDEAQREDDMAIGMQDDELDNSPKRMGMGRMEEEEKTKEEDKNDSKFPDYSGDGKITKKDVLMGKGVIPKPSNKKKTKKDKLKEMIEKELVSLLEVSWIPQDNLLTQFKEKYRQRNGQLKPEYQQIDQAFREDSIVQNDLDGILRKAAALKTEKNRVEQAMRLLMSMQYLDQGAAAAVLKMFNALRGKK